MIPWIEGAMAFPPVETALRDPNGLLCAGGDLSPRRLIEAYQRGIFPWYSNGDPILWWSPDPRMVLFPADFRVSRSLRRILRAGRFAVRLDSSFSAVIHACAATARAGQRGTWITGEMQLAYQRLFRLGIAHSVETWDGERLVGGLYGLAIGRAFFGESMFSLVSNASKVAAAHLARFLEAEGYGMIDCQMSTGHLASLGAREIPREVFVARLRTLLAVAREPGSWPSAGASQPWT